MRYGMVTECLERVWGTEEQPGGGDDGGAVLYDGLLQQLEARLLRLHRLMLDLDVSRLPLAGLQRQPGPRPLGHVTYLPFEVRGSRPPCQGSCPCRGCRPFCCYSLQPD